MSLSQTQYQAFAHYNQTFNQRIYEAAARLSDVDRKGDRGAFFRSIHGTLNHILLADRIWLARFLKAGLGAPALAAASLLESATGMDVELFADFAELWKEREATDAIIVNWSGHLSDTEIVSAMVYKTSKGLERRHAAWLAIAHFFNHQTHHRGQVTTLFSQQGIDVGVTDFLVLAGDFGKLPG